MGIGRIGLIKENDDILQNKKKKRFMFDPSEGRDYS
jgi:hypothetical protein